MTERLKGLTGNFKINVIRQKWQNVSTVALPFNISESLVLIREVFIESNGINYWYARTFFPEPTYKNNESFFRQLAQFSLGELIFNHPHIERVSLSYKRIEQGDVEFDWLPRDVRNPIETYWLRISTFRFHTDFFYLFEILLPHLEYLS